MQNPSRKIAIVTETFPPEINGVANTLRYLCHGLADKGHRLQIVRPRQPQARQVPVHASISAPEDQVSDHQVAGLPLPGYPDLRFGLTTSQRLKRLWCEDRPEAVYVATEGPLGWAAVSAARDLNLPVSAGFHTNFHTYSRYYGAGFLEKLITLYLRRFHNRAGTTLVPTQRMRQYLQTLGVERVQVWSRGVDCDRFSPRWRSTELRHAWGLQDDDLAVLYVGRLAAEKNLQLAVHCYERLRHLHPHAKFVLVGDGPLRRRLQERHPDYIFCGMQKGEALARHYASGDLFLFPSKTDTFGNVVTEALASGLGVVAFDDAAAGEHIHHEINGMKVPLQADADYIQAALKLADQPSLLKQLRHEARQKALELHWREIVEQFEQKVLNPPSEERRHAIKQSVSLL
ncbi:glycosyltransferase family 4 protein [Mangrovitalea sediminis]|uniref:glycosyltransferase family 4 protein n=1 Tax=Mangrovitalea sediminis TaxID=1982043 RepID=UPI000BE6229A|nr:glycosyltransferase family 1 protein [Mangrovitalea sediminis]